MYLKYCTALWTVVGKHGRIHRVYWPDDLNAEVCWRVSIATTMRWLKRPMLGKC